MKRIGLYLLISLGLAFPGTAVLADTLIVESVSYGEAVPQPHHGMSMDQVLERFGEPLERNGPVGEPPITYWTYPDFVVYFEHHTVIHSVVPHR